MTGKAFNFLLNNFLHVNKEDCNVFFNAVKVYSRTKPMDKAKIISLYQSAGKVVSMCGDGANDCGALKQADIGLSLSQA